MGKRGAASLELCADGVRCGVQMFNLLFEHMHQKPAPPPRASGGMQKIVKCCFAVRVGHATYASQ